MERLLLFPAARIVARNLLTDSDRAVCLSAALRLLLFLFRMNRYAGADSYHHPLNNAFDLRQSALLS